MTFGVSAVVWCNDWGKFKAHVLPTLAGTHQVADDGEYELQLIVVSPTAEARNIGHAYNLGMEHAKHPLRIFMHQDVHVHDRRFLQKLHDMFSAPGSRVGAVGTIGSVSDTGAAFFHSPIADHRGRYRGQWWPERKEVKVIDGLLIATTQTFPFSEEYRTVHMAVEDYCMQVRERGLQVWTVDSLVDHESGGQLDDAYWWSAYRFRRKWAHMLPPNLPSLSSYARKGLDTQQVDAAVEWVVL